MRPVRRPVRSASGERARRSHTKPSGSPRLGMRTGERELMLAIRVGAQLRARPQLVLTPRMRQALRILEAPQLELAALLRQELQRNPMLEECEGEPAGEEGGDRLGAPEAEAVASSRGGWEDGAAPWRSARAQPDWREDLLRQYRLQTRDREAIAVAEFLLGCLDGRGYLALPVAEAARCLGRPRGEVERVRRALGRLDPPGIAARSLTECLAAQLAARGAARSLAARIVRTDLTALGRRRYGALARRLHVSVEEVEQAAAQIRTLWPDPAAGRAGSQAPPLVPDLVVEVVDGRREIWLSDAGLPGLRMRRWAAAAGNDADARGFLIHWRARTRWLLGSLAARRRTLRRVAEEILAVQAGFFERGVAGLQPLTYRHLAARLGLHESTIARAVRGKVIQTPRGAFRLRYFFAKGLTEDARPGCVPAAVAQRLRELIADEDQRAPLADAALARALRREGLRIARRTVAKYRARMRIPSAAYRRRIG
ncbi:MAG: RNA polymerase factor sigma-54 [Candidatus Eisenbacteria bacterium]|nr:RNA polymerase factor sigma-54 [Candidatus Eisenbacteria bacterium]